ncbi:radical SAM protein, partial [Elusimicrobiota bacterium]
MEKKIQNKFDSDTRFDKPFIELTDRVKETGEVPLEYIDFDYIPTLRCNLFCKHCRQYEVRKNREWTEIRDEMSLEQLKEAWDKIDVKGKIVKINGGEPFVKKEIWQIFDYFRERGVYNIVATNSFIFSNPENIARIKRYSFVEITTSFDGLGEHHDRVRGSKGLFNTMIGFAKEMSVEHKVLLESCIQKDNIHDLPKMLELKTDLGIYKIRFQLPVFTTKNEIDEINNLLDEELQYEAQTKETPEYDFTYKELMESYNKMIETGIDFDMHPKYFDIDHEACF